MGVVRQDVWMVPPRPTHGIAAPRPAFTTTKLFGYAVINHKIPNPPKIDLGASNTRVSGGNKECLDIVNHGNSNRIGSLWTAFEKNSFRYSVRKIKKYALSQIHFSPSFNTLVQKVPAIPQGMLAPKNHVSNSSGTQ